MAGRVPEHVLKNIIRRIEGELGARASIAELGPPGKQILAVQQLTPYVLAVGYPEAERTSEMHKVAHKIFHEEVAKWNPEHALAGPFPDVGLVVFPHSDPAKAVDATIYSPDGFRNIIKPLGGLAPFVFGEKVHGEFFSEVMAELHKRYGKDVINETIEKERQRLLGLPAKMQKLAEEEKLREEEAKQLLNPTERAQIVNDLWRMVEHFKEKGTKAIIALDRSGRPYGLLMRWAWAEMYPDESVPDLYFLNSKAVREAEHLGPSHWSMVAAQVKEKHPYLYGHIKEHPHKILVLDDQVWQGHTFKAMEKLVAEIGGKKPMMATWSSFWQQRPPSWWYNKGVIGVRPEHDQLISEAFTIGKAVHGKEIRQFREDLRGLAHESAQEFHKQKGRST